MKKDKTKIIYISHSIERNVGLSDTIRIGGWGNFCEVSRVLNEVEAAVLAGILMNFLNKKDLEDDSRTTTHI